MSTACHHHRRHMSLASRRRSTSSRPLALVPAATVRGGRASAGAPHEGGPARPARAARDRSGTTSGARPTGPAARFTPDPRRRRRLARTITRKSQPTSSLNAASRARARTSRQHAYRHQVAAQPVRPRGSSATRWADEISAPTTFEREAARCFAGAKLRADASRRRRDGDAAEERCAPLTIERDHVPVRARAVHDRVAHRTLRERVAVAKQRGARCDQVATWRPRAVHRGQPRDHVTSWRTPTRRAGRDAGSRSAIAKRIRLTCESFDVTAIARGASTRALTTSDDGWARGTESTTRRPPAVGADADRTAARAPDIEALPARASRRAARCASPPAEAAQAVHFCALERGGQRAAVVPQLAGAAGRVGDPARDVRLGDDEHAAALERRGDRARPAAGARRRGRAPDRCRRPSRARPRGPRSRPTRPTKCPTDQSGSGPAARSPRSR